MELVLYCFMGMTALMDFKNREISGWMFWVFGVIGLVGKIGDFWGGNRLAGIESAVLVTGSAAVGLGLLVISRLVQGAVGEGDGWFFVVTGLYVPWNINLGLLCYGLLLCCIYGIVLTSLGVIKGVSVRKKKIPFLPFVSMAGIFMYASHMWQF